MNAIRNATIKTIGDEKNPKMGSNLQLVEFPFKVFRRNVKNIFTLKLIDGLLMGILG